ncbi:MAG: histidine phosphatase family protein [Acidimicrobiales bacterium]|nr:histidine phosphatase family protein [Acidimicrobiales bacterium]
MHAVDEGAEHPSQRIVLVRHAQTEWSLSGQHTGTTDLALTDAGRALTEHLRHRLEGAHDPLARPRHPPRTSPRPRHRQRERAGLEARTPRARRRSNRAGRRSLTTAASTPTEPARLLFIRRG